MRIQLLCLIPFLATLPAGCRTPSRDIAAQPGDFALLEVQLRG